MLTTGGAMSFAPVPAVGPTFVIVIYVPGTCPLFLSFRFRILLLQTCPGERIRGKKRRQGLIATYQPILLFSDLPWNVLQFDDSKMPINLQVPSIRQSHGLFWKKVAA
jgi:hypothetical protein